MYAICKTSGKDVLKCVERMSTMGSRYPVFQTTDNRYTELERDQSDVPEFVQSRKPRHKINVSTRTIHSTKCKNAGEDTVKAAILRVKATGLHVCKKCMRVR